MTHLKKTKKLGIIMPKLGYSMPNAKYSEAKQKSAEILCHNIAVMSYALYPNVDGGLIEQNKQNYKDTVKTTLTESTIVSAQLLYKLSEDAKISLKK